MYNNGQGVIQDYKEAVKWYTKAAEQGNVDAQYNLGLMYNNGQGVIQDYKEAVKWYTKAAEQGNVDAQYNLGLMYYKGQGVPKDYVMAHMYWNISGVSGYKNVINNRGIVEKQMTSSQIEKAQLLAREWSRSNISTNVGPLVRIAPRYPMIAVIQRIEGWVKVQFTITKEGKVSNAIVVDSNPKNVFDHSSLSAIKRWKFKPKLIRGVPYEQRAEQLLEFKLRRSKPTPPFEVKSIYR